MKMTFDEFKSIMPDKDLFDEPSYLDILKEMGVVFNEDNTLDIPDSLLEPQDKLNMEIGKNIEILIDKVNEHSKAINELYGLIKELHEYDLEIIKATQRSDNIVLKTLGFSLSIICDINKIDPVTDLTRIFKDLPASKIIEYCTQYPFMMRELNHEYRLVSNINWDDASYDSTLKEILKFYVEVVIRSDELGKDELKSFLDNNHDVMMIMSTIARNTDTLDFDQVEYLCKSFDIIKDNCPDKLYEYLPLDDYDNLMTVRTEMVVKLMNSNRGDSNEN